MAYLLASLLIELMVFSISEGIVDFSKTRQLDATHVYADVLKHAKNATIAQVHILVFGPNLFMMNDFPRPILIKFVI